MVDKDMQLFAVVDLWREFAEYIALEFRSLFVKCEIATLAAVTAVARAVIRHDLPSFSIRCNARNARTPCPACRACDRQSSLAPMLPLLPAFRIHKVHDQKHH